MIKSTKLKKFANNEQGKKEVERLLNEVQNNSDGLAVVFNFDTGELMSLVHGMCHHEVQEILMDVVEKIKKNELTSIHKETKEELAILERQEKSRIKN